MSPRCQQGPLYAAEERARERTLPQELGVDDAQLLVDGWAGLDWWRTNFPAVRRVEVHAGRGTDRASVGGFLPDRNAGVVQMHASHLNPLYLAHEVAHVLAQARYGSRSHDPWFARTYLTLVYFGLGSAAYKALYDEFEAAGIDHHTDD